MKTVCFYFQVHQPLRLKKYRFFSIGKDHNYLDDLHNRSIINDIATRCYLPMNNNLLELIKESKGALKISFSISGLAIEQFRSYAPQVLDSFKALAKTGCVEFLAETYSHSLASLIDPVEFESDVKRHCDLIESEFGMRPTAFRNTELIYSDSIGADVAKMGFKSMVAEGARHILGWKSPNYVYANSQNQKLRLLLRNYKLSDDISLRFSNREWNDWPLTADKFAGWITGESTPGEVINLFMSYETFGLHHSADSGIFDFMRALIKTLVANEGIQFSTVSEATVENQPIAVLHSPYAMSWTDEERDVTAWLGNELQNEAFSKLYALKDRVEKINSEDFNYKWRFMQCSDHFYYMATKWLSDGSGQNYFNPYDSAYEAFIIYMNIISDFELELDKEVAKLDQSSELF